MDPRRNKSRNGHRSSPLDLCPVPLSELLHLMTALHGRFRRRSHGTTFSHRIRHFLPMVSSCDQQGSSRLGLGVTVAFPSGMGVDKGGAGKARRCSVGGGGSCSDRFDMSDQIDVSNMGLKTREAVEAYVSKVGDGQLAVRGEEKEKEKKVKVDGATAEDN
ncbi:hypothetical protein F3Y22_tig00116951pilonHSYRG00700 [Hibiscus syriacus]|uniref:Uncharacterized protein n=1 Tax=Hibiscus syriacus TaxID=106335 RepID=A0A6A2XF53_HIBSY|nr:hypothetical protein F3Y22_tig00116951pilonHSYRG00700 [Hibiscus syriacus]